METEPMYEPIATISWCGLDVKGIHPEWTDEQCMKALDAVCSELEDRCIEEGWNILDSLLQMYVDNLEEEDE